MFLTKYQQQWQLPSRPLSYWFNTPSVIVPLIVLICLIQNVTFVLSMVNYQHLMLDSTFPKISSLQVRFLCTPNGVMKQHSQISNPYYSKNIIQPPLHSRSSRRCVLMSSQNGEASNKKGSTKSSSTSSRSSANKRRQKSFSNKDRKGSQSASNNNKQPKRNGGAPQRERGNKSGSKATENSFDRVIRVLSKPADIKTYGKSTSASKGNGSRQFQGSNNSNAYVSRKLKKHRWQKRPSLMTNVTATSISSSRGVQRDKSISISLRASKSSANGNKTVETLPHVQRKGPPVNVDPPYRKVEIFYDGDGDLFTAITTSSRYYGSHMWIDQADKLTRRFKALWVQQWYRHAEKWQVAPAFMKEAVRESISKTDVAPKLGVESTVYGLDVQSKGGGNGAALPLRSEVKRSVVKSTPENKFVRPQTGTTFAAVPPWPDSTSQQSNINSGKTMAKKPIEKKIARRVDSKESPNSPESSPLILDPVQLRPLGPLLLDAATQRLKAQHPRVIAIGDVHGCVDELQALLRRVGYSPGDQLVFLGDMVAKGPDSQAVVQLARELGGIAVRGNHEFEVLRWHRVLQKGGDPPLLASEHYRLARSMPPQDLEWLHLTPWFFNSEHLGTLFVHAGFVHEKSLSRQNPRLMMNMRSILPDGTVTSKHFSSWPWARCWKGPQTVLFGHDAERGLQVHEHALGIDTGCVYGGRLTACILPEKKIVSVNAKREYAPFRKRARKLLPNKEQQNELQEQSALENDPENMVDE